MYLDNFKNIEFLEVPNDFHVDVKQPQHVAGIRLKQNTRRRFVNPDKVESIGENQRYENVCNIMMQSGETIVVYGTLDEVNNKLTKFDSPQNNNRFLLNEEKQNG